MLSDFYLGWNSLYDRLEKLSKDNSKMSLKEALIEAKELEKATILKSPMIVYTKTDKKGNLTIDNDKTNEAHLNFVKDIFENLPIEFEIVNDDSREAHKIAKSYNLEMLTTSQIEIAIYSFIEQSQEKPEELPKENITLLYVNINQILKAYDLHKSEFCDFVKKYSGALERFSVYKFAEELTKSHKILSF